MEPGIGIKCPSCGVLFLEPEGTWSDNSSDTSNFEEDGQPYMVCAVLKCLGCAKPVVCLTTFRYCLSLNLV